MVSGAGGSSMYRLPQLWHSETLRQFLALWVLITAIGVVVLGLTVVSWFMGAERPYLMFLVCGILVGVNTLGFIRAVITRAGDIRREMTEA